MFTNECQIVCFKSLNPRGDTQKNFDRDAHVTFLGFENSQFVIFWGLKK